jgi:hypothetical protein
MDNPSNKQVSQSNLFPPNFFRHVGPLGRCFEQHIIGIFGSGGAISFFEMMHSLIQDINQFLFLFFGHEVGALFVEEVAFDQEEEQSAFTVIKIDQVVAEGGLFMRNQGLPAQLCHLQLEQFGIAPLAVSKLSVFSESVS